MPELQVLTGPRLSAAASCPRMCVLGALRGEDGEPLYEPVESIPDISRYRARGQLFELYVAHQYIEKYGRENIQCIVNGQREIPWPAGVGHADIYVIPEKTLVEVVSTTSPLGALAYKAEQVRRYLHFDPEAKAAGVYVVNPSSLKGEQFYPVFLSDDDRKRIDAETEAIMDGLNGGPLPACSKPNPTICRASFCGFTDVAWQDWEQPSVEEVQSDAEVLQLIREYCQEREAYRIHNQAKNESSERLDEIKARLFVPFDRSGLEYVCDGYSVKRVDVSGREMFQLSAARASGAWTAADEERLADFISVGEGHSRIYIKEPTVPAAPETVEYDFGDDPPF